MKKPSLVAIFAHPDDEAFGPAGTLYKYSKTHDVYLICATSGESGENHTNSSSKPLSEIRKNELKNSAQILGVKKVFFLGLKDGTLCNNNYHKTAASIQKITDKIKPEILMTYEHRGVSGHLDHVSVSMIVSYLFGRIDYAKKLMLYVILKNITEKMKDYFIYVPDGIKKNNADEIFDISNEWSYKIKAISCHKSQKVDVSKFLKQLKSIPKEEYFFVHNKT